VAATLKRYAAPTPRAISVNMFALRVRIDAQPRSRSGQPEPELPVGLDALGLVESTDPGHRTPTYGKRHDVRRACSRKGMEGVPVQVARALLSVEHATVVEVDSAPAAVEDLRSGSSRCGLDESRQIAWRKEVVGVEEYEQLAPGECDTSIPRRRHTAPARAVDGYSSGEAGEQVGCPIGRSVVHHDQLRVSVLLCKHALHRIGDERLPVPDGDDDGDGNHE
jgi:hypothetical protein